MAKSFAQIQKEIARLKQEADALKAQEVAGVIKRIKEAIAQYGLTAKDLFGPKAATRGPASKKAKSPVAPKFRDGAGNTWTGRGRRPAWFMQALAAGKTPEDLMIKRSG